MQKKLTKSASNKLLSGTLAGIGEYLGWTDSQITLLRIGYAVLSVFSAGFPGALLYLILLLVIPSANKSDSVSADKHDTDDYGW
ncbi:MAG: PspC domain-containing protein [Streptococcaceae bacterium]|nr:PspC domain-containing protein [Streptococcaceae bacterium]